MPINRYFNRSTSRLSSAGNSVCHKRQIRDLFEREFLEFRTAFVHPQSPSRLSLSRWPSVFFFLFFFFIYLFLGEFCPLEIRCVTNSFSAKLFMTRVR